MATFNIGTIFPERETVNSMAPEGLSPAWRLAAFFGVSTKHGMRHAMASIIRLIKGKLPEYDITAAQAQCLACVVYKAAKTEWFTREDLPAFGAPKSYSNHLIRLEEAGILISERNDTREYKRYTLAIPLDRFI
jgi:DNA-binding transcriptional ArsR family regulator